MLCCVCAGAFYQPSGEERGRQAGRELGVLLKEVKAVLPPIDFASSVDVDSVGREGGKREPYCMSRIAMSLPPMYTRDGEGFFLFFSSSSWHSGLEPNHK